MLDAAARKLIDPPLDAIARHLARTGVSANTITLAGLALGIGAAGAIAFGAYTIALVLLLVSRVADGLDGAVARSREAGPTEFGGYLDIVADFALWALLPLGFAFANPAHALPAAVLLASFIGSGTTFLAYAILAAKAGEESRERGTKSFFHLGGLTEGTETILFFVLVLLWPSLFGIGALIFAGFALLTALGRINMARKIYGKP